MCRGCHRRLGNGTAHGDAVNTAARLQACNKELGSAICVGPHAAARCDAALLRPLGQLAVRGREEPIAVFEPWPDDAPPAWREAYLKAYALLECDAARAGMLLQKLMAERPADLAMRRLAARLLSIRKPSGVAGADQVIHRPRNLCFCLARFGPPARSAFAPVLSDFGEALKKIGAAPKRHTIEPLFS